MKSYKILLILGVVLIVASGISRYLNDNEVGRYSNIWSDSELQDNGYLGKGHMFYEALDEDFDYKAHLETLGEYDIISVMPMHEYIRCVVKSGDNYEIILYDIDKDEIIEQYDMDKEFRRCLDVNAFIV